MGWEDEDIGGLKSQLSDICRYLDRILVVAILILVVVAVVAAFILFKN